MNTQPQTRFLRAEVLAIPVALIAGALVVFFFFGGGSDDDLSGGAAVRIKPVLTPRSQLFGDTLVARIDVAVDTGRVDPDSVRFRARFNRYRLVSPAVTGRRTLRGAEYISWTAPLRCLELACLPREAGTRVVFPPARVAYSLSDERRTRQIAIVRWPEVHVYSRVDAAELASRDPRSEPPWRADLASFPDVTFSASPSLLAAALFAAGAMLVAGMLILLRPLLLPAIGWGRGRAAPQVPALEQALVLLENDGDTPAAIDARRQALELVAGELGRLGEHDLELSARRLAWSANPPPHEDTRILARNVRGLGEKVGNGRIA